MNRPIKLFFIASLLLNLLLAGVIIGHVWWHISGHHGSMADQISPPLTAEQKANVDAAMRQIHEKSDGLRAEIAAARDEANKLMTADPFDKTAYLAATKHIQELHEKMGQAVSAKMADLADAMTPEERAGLLDAMHRMMADRPPPENHVTLPKMN